MEKPTVGRKVWLWSVPGAPAQDPSQPFDATIVYVWGDDCVNVTFTNHWGTSGSMSSVPLVNPRLPGPGEDGGRHGVMDRHGEHLHATWMPYQMKAAAAARQHPAVAASSPISENTAS